jgi:selenocysteine lyase/cysteine desulfurase
VDQHVDVESFLEQWPVFAPGGPVERLRREEFARLDAGGHVYLDYTGAGLAPSSLVERHAGLLLGGVLGNPHSGSPASRAATELVERARRHVLSFFNASPAEYVVVFTANASHALKLVGESYPFGPDTAFVLTFDNHNSVNGIREYARAAGARVTYIPVTPPDLRVDPAAAAVALDPAGRARPGLFAFPAQSNFSGAQHDLEMIDAARARGWDVLLDAAALVPTSRLDLAERSPDFVVLSFYKMFGYPTGVGALVARREALDRLRRPWFAGGTIAMASVGADRHRLAAGAAAFEDGTVNFTSLPAVDFGLDFIEEVGIDVIHRRVGALAGWMIGALLSLRHANGTPLVALYGPSENRARGGTITVNFRDAGGRVIDHAIIEERAGARGISIRAGCFCNPGAGELAMGLSPDEMRACFVRLSDRITYDEFRRCIDGKSTGAVRASLGLASTIGDAAAFVEFARSFLG